MKFCFQTGVSFVFGPVVYQYCDLPLNHNAGRVFQHDNCLHTLTSLHKAWALTSSNTFGIYRNSHCEPSHISRHQFSTPLKPTRLNREDKSPQQLLESLKAAEQRQSQQLFDGRKVVKKRNILGTFARKWQLKKIYQMNEENTNQRFVFYLYWKMLLLYG